ncbi:MAG: hypothetical protein QW478_02565 [Candidatus Micrarchaeaceae archaeon]
MDTNILKLKDGYYECVILDDKILIVRNDKGEKINKFCNEKYKIVVPENIKKGWFTVHDKKHLNIIKNLAVELEKEKKDFDKILWLANVMFFIDGHPLINNEILNYCISNYLDDKKMNIFKNKDILKYILEIHDLKI